MGTQSKSPRDEDWQAIIKYSERVRRITYDEAANNVAPSIFSVFEERPHAITSILPCLQELTWKVETAAALERCALFFNPELQYINLEIGTKLPKIGNFLADMSSRTNLKGFSFIAPTGLPDAFTELILPQNRLEKVVLMAPGALSPGVGRWVASLPHLKQFQIDLTGRAPISVEGFFDELRPRSGDSTPSSIGSRDSGVFSGEELDFTEIRKSALRLTGDLPPKGSFVTLRKLQLAGSVANIAVFLKHLDSALTQLDLVIEDPPDNADWQDLSEMICERFADSLQSIRITSTPSSRFADLVRSTSRAEPPSGRLSLERFSGLSELTRLDIDLPESIVFTPADIVSIAKACPNLEILKLCPLSWFPVNHSPKLTLESLAPLVEHCKRLHTLAVVFNAGPGSDQILKSPKLSSSSILRLHVGHSWANDPLQTSILLSHFMPRLELLKWFQEKNRAGFNEFNAKTWQSVSETLPHIQLLRLTEKSFLPTPAPAPPVIQTSEKSIDATVRTNSRGVLARLSMSEASVQCSPVVEEREVQAEVEHCEVSVDATTPCQSVGVETSPPEPDSNVPAELPRESATISHPLSNIYLITSLFNLIGIAYRLAVWPLSIPSRILQLAMPHFHSRKTPRPLQSLRNDTGVQHEELTSHVDSIPMNNLEVRQ